MMTGKKAEWFKKKKKQSRGPQKWVLKINREWKEISICLPPANDYFGVRSVCWLFSLRPLWVITPDPASENQQRSADLHCREFKHQDGPAHYSASIRPLPPPRPDSEQRLLFSPAWSPTAWTGISCGRELRGRGILGPSTSTSCPC